MYSSLDMYYIMVMLHRAEYMAGHCDLDDSKTWSSILSGLRSLYDRMRGGDNGEEGDN